MEAMITGAMTNIAGWKIRKIDRCHFWLDWREWL